MVVGSIPTGSTMKKSIESVLILPDIRSALNVGSIFRTADAIGISRICLAGYTPRPTDVFGRVQKDIQKAALGAELWVPWEFCKSVPTYIKRLKKEGYCIVALEQDTKSIDYKAFSKILRKSDFLKIAIIVGSEVEGVDKAILRLCDYIIEIPMKGKKESLNVSVATGIALFEILEP